MAFEFDYRSEAKRLESFAGWTIPNPNPRILAAAGFYYTKRENTVRCFECKVEIRQWESGENPLGQHFCLRPLCRFVKNFPCGNIPLGNEAEASPEELKYYLDPRISPYLNTTPFLQNIWTSPPYIPKRIRKTDFRVRWSPQNPEYKTPEVRLQSFSNWPKESVKGKKDLVEAGFFYTGRTDQTVCFHCGGGLTDWEENDDPWIEHIRWFATCHFVLRNKGANFIRNLQIEQRQIINEGNLRRLTHLPLMGGICRICRINRVERSYLPCNHSVACTSCARTVERCPKCNRPINYVVLTPRI